MTLPGVSSAEQVIPSSCSNSTNPWPDKPGRFPDHHVCVMGSRRGSGDTRIPPCRNRIVVKKEISLGFTFIKGIVFVANGIIFFTNRRSKASESRKSPGDQINAFGSGLKLEELCRCQLATGTRKAE